jgi:hypothetical protein
MSRTYRQIGLAAGHHQEPKGIRKVKVSRVANMSAVDELLEEGFYPSPRDMFQANRELHSSSYYVAAKHEVFKAK